MAFIIFFLKKFEKVEKTGIISTKFLSQCTLSVILGLNGYWDNFDFIGQFSLDKIKVISPKIHFFQSQSKILFVF